MGAIDHRSARGPPPPIGARSTEDIYTQPVWFREARKAKDRDRSELVSRSQASRSGYNSIIDLAVAGIAHTLERRSLDTKFRVLGLNHPETVTTMSKLCALWLRQGRFEIVEPLQAHLLNFGREVFGPVHPSTLSTMASLAVTLDQLGRHKEAESTELQVLDLRKQTMGERHPSVYQAMAQLAITWSYQGRDDESNNYATQVFEVRKERLGLRHFRPVSAMESLADNWYKLAKYHKAETARAEVLALTKELYGKGDVRTFEAMDKLAEVWWMLGQYDEAEMLLGGMSRLALKALGENHPLTVEAVTKGALWKEAREGRKALASSEFHESSDQSPDAAVSAKQAPQHFLCSPPTNKYDWWFVNRALIKSTCQHHGGDPETVFGIFHKQPASVF